MKINCLVPTVFPFLLLLGCGGSDTGSSSIPPEATAMASKLKSGMSRSVQRLAGYEASLIFVLNPGSPLSSNITVSPDNTPGAPLFSYIFSGPFDGNEDGYNETTLTGQSTFISDPASEWDGLDGQVSIDVHILGGLHSYAGDMHFTRASDEERVSGTGTFTEFLGDQTTLTVDSTKPLAIRPATGSPGAVANACGYSLDGDLRIDVAGSDGMYSSTWTFSSNLPNAAVTGATFTDNAGKMTALPDTSVNLQCGSGASINDWVGTYTQNYSCFPRESGQAQLSITVTGPNTISITDEDPPGSGQFNMYQASFSGTNPSVVRGFFIGGPAGSTYREDFTWTLAINGSGFIQTSVYVYQEGPLTGKAGLCVASAKR